MPEFIRKSHKLVSRGLDLAHPVDLMPEGKYPVLMNVRSLVDGTLTGRDGLVGVNAIPLADAFIHSIRRLNSDVTADWTRVIGAGTNLYTGKDAFTVQDTGYSGNPLTMTAFRPDRSPDPWMYVGDSNKMRKVKVTGQDYEMGVAPPTAPPETGYGVPNTIDVSDFEVIGGWAAGGTAGALSTPNRFSTTIANILFDVGADGWCSINPTAMDANFQPGAYVLISGTERGIIREVFNPLTNSQIGGIIYDSGTTGYCSITLVASSDGLRPNALLSIGGEIVRIISVTDGGDGIPSFRCVTTLPHLPLAAVLGLPSFRVWLSGFFGPGSSIVSKALQTTVATGVGTVQQTITLNIATINGRPVIADDYVHISLLVDNPANIVEGKVMFDIGDGSFTQNYYYRSFRAADITPNAQGSLTALTTQQRSIQRNIVDSYKYEYGVYNGYADLADQYGQGLNVDSTISTDGSSEQFIPGNSQWTELKFKLADMIRIGSDQSKSLRDVGTVRVQLQVTASTLLLMDAWWVGGTYGADLGQTGAPIQYGYRYRASATGAKSNLSPITRSGVTPARERVTVSVQASIDPQVDLIDIFRFGGGLDKWKLVGTYANATTIYNDDLAIQTIQINEDLEFDNYRPFPVSDLPRSGVCQAVGTSVSWVSGEQFNVNWAPGSIININGVPQLLYQVLSPVILQIVDSIFAINVPFTLPEPTITATPLPVIWSFGGQGIGTFVMGVGDTYNPGYLYWCKSNDPDAASDSGNLEITSPSEPLMNGCEYDGRAFTFSSARLFTVLMDGGTNKFSSQVVLSKGLYGRYGMAVTPYGIAWISNDGINLWNGTLSSLTDTDLYPFFPHNGVIPSEVINGYTPPDFTAPDLLRLVSVGNSLYFLYPEQNTGIYRAMVFDFAHAGWFPSNFTPVARIVYAEEGKNLESVLLGGINGRVYQSDNVPDDDGAQIQGIIRTPSMDYGDPRIDKLFGDTQLDSNTNGVDVLVSVLGQTGTGTAAIQTVNTVSRTKTIIDIFGGLGMFSTNITLSISWVSSTATPVFFEWACSVVPKVEETHRRATDWTSDGQAGSKFLRGCIVEADIFPTATGLDLAVTGTNRVASGSYTFVITDVNAILQIVGGSGWSQGTYYITSVSGGAAVLDRSPAPLGSVSGDFILAGTKPVQVQYDGGSVAATLTLSHPGQTLEPYAFTPVVCKEMRLAPTDATAFKSLNVTWLWEPYPEYLQLIDDYSVTQWPSYKYVRGVAIEGDSQGVQITLLAQADQSATVIPLTLTQTGKSLDEFGFTAPFLAREMRLIPVGRWRKFSVRWIYDEYPDFCQLITPWTDGGTKGMKYLRGAIVKANTNNLPITINLQADGAGTSFGPSITADGLQEIGLAFNPPIPVFQMRWVPDGNWMHWETVWIYDEYPYLSRIRTPWMHGGAVGPKHIRGLRLTADSSNLPVDIPIEIDGNVVATTIPGIIHNGKQAKGYAFNPPFIAYMMRLAPAGDVRIFDAEMEWIFDAYPDLIPIYTKWEDGGYLGYKFMQGLVVETDSAGQLVTIQVQYDNEQLGPTFTVQTTGKTATPVSFSVPFYAHDLRLVPLGNVRIFEPIKWVFEPTPEPAVTWKTQGTTHGLTGYQHLRDGFIAYISHSQISLIVNIDGVDYTYTLPSTGGLYAKLPFIASPAKGKLYQYTVFCSTGLQLFQKDCEVRVKGWGDNGPYQIVNPFGDIHRVAGARI